MRLKNGISGAEDGLFSRPISAATLPAEGLNRHAGRMKRAGLCSAVTLAFLTFAAAPAMAQFGLERFAVGAQNENGTPDVQAGSHPYSLTTTFILRPAREDLKDASVELPPGLVGDTSATPKCTFQEFAKGKLVPRVPTCGNATAVGVATTYLYTSARPDEPEVLTEPVYNLVPQKGAAAEFGVLVGKKAPILLTTSVRTGGDYGLTTTASEVNQAALVLASKVTIWGVPAAQSHDLIRGECESGRVSANFPLELIGRGLHGAEAERETPVHEETEPGWSEVYAGLPEPTPTSEETGGCPAHAPEVPLLTNPTACGTPRTASIAVDSWQEPGVFFAKSTSLPELVGCGKLDFSPTTEAAPATKAASSPSGLNVALRVPQISPETPNGLAEADVRDTTIVLPPGMQLSPSAADGLQACAQLHGAGNEVAEEQRELSGINLETKQPANCPDASKVADVTVTSPLLEHPLTGGMYLAAPQNFAGLPENPFSSLTAMYLVAEEPQTGVLVKLAGDVTRNEVTGQLTSTFENTPQLPYSELKVDFFGGERAPLATPAFCGAYTTQATFTPWSGTPQVNAPSSFNIESGPVTPAQPGGSVCPGSTLPFSPSLVADSTNVNAGAFSQLATTLSREDGQQSIQSVVLHYPPGMAGIIAGIPLCPELQANSGSCSPESLIGETTASVGLGNDPYTVTGGKVYLTEHYAGAPFGLSIVTPAKAGPFVLQQGRPVVTRAKVEVNPQTAALTVTTGQIPQIIEGFPLQIKHINVLVNRPNFAFNPTSCEPTSITGTVIGWGGASSLVSSPFQVGDCAALKYQPTLSVSSGGHASKRDGASLTFKIAYPKGSMGAQAWFKEAKFDIPKQLPARLDTLQQACLLATFERDRSACPKHSQVGTVIVHTPVLPVPLEGEVYFVSYGNTKFPNVVMTLSGDNVNIELVGETLIKHGVTSATFTSLPDVPFESVEVTLPTGEYSEFGSYINARHPYQLCGTQLKVPTLLKAQNGLEIEQSTPVTITGCAKPRHKHKRKHR